MPVKHATVLFVASDQTLLSRQCLRILKQLGCTTAELDDGVAGPPGSWFLFTCNDPSAKFPSGFLRVAGLERSGITVPDHAGAAARIIAIRGARLLPHHHREFAGKELEGLTHALENLCGYTAPETIEKRAARRAGKAERLEEHRRERRERSFSSFVH